MEFMISEELRMIQSTLRKLVNNDIRPRLAQLDADAIELPERDKMELREKVKNLGMQAMGAPVEYGGGGVGLLGLCLAAEELAKHKLGCYRPTLGAFCGVYAGETPGNLLFCNAEQKERYLLPAIRLQKQSCFALTEPDAGTDTANIRTSAVREGDHWILNGEKRFITGGDSADFAMVFAVTDKKLRAKGGITCFLVDKGTPGFKVARLIPVIRPWYPAELVFTDCPVPAQNVLGEVGQGFEMIQTWLGQNRLLYSANVVGTADESLRLSTEYANVRQTFGQPLSSRQAIQWLIADSAVELYAARLLIYACAWKTENNIGGDLRMEVSMAKIFATEMMGRVVDRAIQVHGGMGVSKELPLERWYREGRIKRIGEGTSEIHRQVISRGILRGFYHYNPFEKTN
jgi:acyl-CoA dehydrogenase